MRQDWSKRRILYASSQIIELHLYDNYCQIEEKTTN